MKIAPPPLLQQKHLVDMSKTIYIKLTRVGATSGPFDIYDQSNNPIASDVTRHSLINGVSYVVSDSVSAIRMVSTGMCSFERTVMINDGWDHGDYEIVATGCIWRHLIDPLHYNYFYGAVSPYIIEYPFAYQYYDEIVRNVKDFTRVYKYVPGYDAAYSTATRIETDDDFFNKAIVYNGQQCSGLLELVVKPRRNLKEYMSYPKYNADSKTITFTKSDSWYQYNDFWDVMSDKTKQMFLPTCENLSIDKVLNQSNMDYSYRSFLKAPIRGKDTRIRMILDNKSDIHLVSRMIYAPAMISYK